jgi:hypothetical protein
MMPKYNIKILLNSGKVVRDRITSTNALYATIRTVQLNNCDIDEISAIQTNEAAGETTKI